MMETPARRSSRYGTRVAAALAQQVICDLVSYDEVSAIVDEEDENEKLRSSTSSSSSSRYHNHTTATGNHGNQNKSTASTTNDFTTTIKQIKSNQPSKLVSSNSSSSLSSSSSSSSSTSSSPSSSTLSSPTSAASPASTLVSDIQFNTRTSNASTNHNSKSNSSRGHQSKNTSRCSVSIKSEPCSSTTTTTTTASASASTTTITPVTLSSSSSSLTTPTTALTATERDSSKSPDTIADCISSPTRPPPAESNNNMLLLTDSTNNCSTQLFKASPASSSSRGSGGVGGLTIVDDENQHGNQLVNFSSNLFSAYQTWALKTYGDSAKTKTVTRKKYQRIVKILKGEESTNVENSKFRFWVKAKGFKLRAAASAASTSTLTATTTTRAMTATRAVSIDGQISKILDSEYENDQEADENILLVPCTKVSPNNLGQTGDCGDVVINTNNNKHQQQHQDETIYKKVAVVENFYKIIYNVHVEMDGRSGKHAGQKRTYRAVAEMYAFLPREAVTRFLMSCSDCQKRMHLQGINTSSSTNGNGNHHPHHQHHHLSTSPLSSSSNSYQKKSSSSRRSNNSITSLKPIRKSNGATSATAAAINNKSSNDCNRNSNQIDKLDLDFSLPITATYLKRMKSLGYNNNNEISNSNHNHNHIEHGILPYTVICDQSTTYSHHHSHHNHHHHHHQDQDQTNQQITGSSSSPIQINGEEPVSGSEYNSEISIDSNDVHNNRIISKSNLLDEGTQFNEDEDEEQEEEEEEEEGSREVESNPTTTTKETTKATFYNNDKLVAINKCKSSSLLTMDDVDAIDESTDLSGPLDMTRPMRSRRSSPESSPPNYSFTSGDNSITTISTAVNSQMVIKGHRSPINTRGMPTKRKATASPKSLSSSSSSIKDPQHDHHHHRPEKMVAFNGGVDEMTPTSDYTLKEEEEDEDDEEEVDTKLDDKTDVNNFDPERLKAFNMFVRLFVDENLDRMVPISRQPKDKVQAIIESCMRQFPEFSDRARKRVRTYLKSCRRTRRHKTNTGTTTTTTTTTSSTINSTQLPSIISTIGNHSKDSTNNNSSSLLTNGIEISRVSSTGTCLSSTLSSTSSAYHLTSPIAEQILASACANETYNAKRMRAGLKPLPGRSISPSVRDSSRCDHLIITESQTINDNLGSILPSTTSPSSESAVQVLKPSGANSSLNSTLLAALTGHPKNESGDTNRSTENMEPLMLLNKKQTNNSPTRSDELENAGRQANQSCPTVNGNGPVSLSTPSSMVPLSTSSPSTFSSSSPGSGSNNAIHNGVSHNNNAGSHHQSSNYNNQQHGLSSNYLPYTYLLSPGETAAIKTLIAGYRESAAFLLRSANELENLLLQQT